VPFLVLLMALGAYSSTNSYGDVLVMLAAAAIGVACIRWNWPRIPFLLAVVLGSLAERYLFVSYSLFGWSWLARPVVIGLLVVMALVLFAPLIRYLRTRRRDRSRNEVTVP
jgi:TctA family transporter